MSEHTPIDRAIQTITETKDYKKNDINVLEAVRFLAYDCVPLNTKHISKLMPALPKMSERFGVLTVSIIDHVLASIERQKKQDNDIGSVICLRKAAHQSLDILIHLFQEKSTADIDVNNRCLLLQRVVEVMPDKDLEKKVQNEVRAITSAYHVSKPAKAQKTIVPFCSPHSKTTLCSICGRMIPTYYERG